MSQAITDAILSYKSNLDQNVGENIEIDSQDVEDDDLIYREINFKVQIAASSNSFRIMRITMN